MAALPERSAPTCPAARGSASRLRLWWQEYQWPVLGLLGVVTLGLGIWGFYLLSVANNEPRPWTDYIYLALQLFTLESGSAPGPKAWPLEVARLLAPGLVAYATVKAALTLFREQWRRCRLPFWRQHVVVCGLGEKGRRLAEQFLARGERVVVVERDEADGHMAAVQEQGALVLLGDAANPTLLAKARVPGAKHLLAVTGDDGVNVEIAVQAQKLLTSANPAGGGASPGERWCLVHLQETKLRELLSRTALFTGCQGACRARFFDIYENAARLVFREYPPDAYAQQQGREDVHLVIIGFGRLGENLALQAARMGHYASGQPVRLTVVDAAAEKKIKLFLARYPQFTNICQLSWHTLRLEDPEFFELTFLGESKPPPSPTMAFICLEDEKLGFLGALHLFQSLPAPPFPILVRVRSLTGLASLAQAGLAQFPRGGGIYPFGSIEATCDLDLILNERLDELAKRYHISYVRLEESRGVTPQQNPSTVPWEELPEDLKNSNRLLAEHFWVKVRALENLGYRLRDQRPGEVEPPPCAFTEAEIELLARMEHSRWNAERWLAGWSFCEADVDKQTRLAKKLSPYLVPYDDLPEEIKEYDRNYARDIPALLSRDGKVLEPPER
jgi:hypothetical protein